MSSNLVGIGEVLWDLLPDGPQLGGAPANFAYQAQALGANATVITRVGNDPLGRAVRSRFQGMGLSVTGIQQDEAAPTGTVEVTLASGGIPTYVIHENAAWDHIAVSPAALACVSVAHAVCFGSLAQRHVASRHSIQRLVSSAPATAWRVLDVNLRQDYFKPEVVEHSLELANVLKLNEHELPVIAGMFGIGGDTRHQIQSLASRFGLQVVALTCGARGSLLHRDGQWSQGAPVAVTVKDTVGAGDAFTAALCLGLLRGLELGEINRAANRIAAYVCGCAGAMPELPAELRQLFKPDPAAPGGVGPCASAS
jgi:fructokinase